ncbi:MAG: hypothetical protein HOQ05_06885 [Corynebacteriales bacterium]|nr:hypothetical protein [Mycobacteriales bacterium]
MSAHSARRRVLTIAAASCVALTIGACGQQTRYTHSQQPTIMLASFDSCDQALTGLQKAASDAVGPYGLPNSNSRALTTQEDSASSDMKSTAPTAPSPESADEHSTTNNQESGIDEPDAVKNDGKRIYTLSDGTLRIIDAKARSIIGSIDLSDQETGLTPNQLMVSGDRALVVMQGVITLAEPAQSNAKIAPGGGQNGSKVLLVELDESPTVLSSVSIEGSYIDARQIDDTVRLVSSSGPRLDFPQDAPEASGTRGEKRAIEQNREVINASSIETWLPRFQVEENGKTESRQTPCGNVSHAADYSGSNMLTVFTLGFDTISKTDPVTIAADGSTVYSSATTLYIAGENYQTFEPEPGAEIDEQTLSTELYAFDISGDEQPKHIASGSVPGMLLNQYSMSEHEGHLRIATTNVVGSVTCCDQEPPSESAVYVLKRDGNSLNIVGQVGGLGKTEQIYAVRFIGDAGYVVTFRQTDPLYVVDLSTPTAPTVRGELKITGYSAYLHPASENTLLGVGQEASEQGQRQGLQVSLFDISDPATPNRLDQYHITDASSTAEYDPHAFLYWEKTGLLAVPYMNSGSATTTQDGEVASQLDTGVIVLKVDKESLREITKIQHPAGDQYGNEITRSLIIGDTLWTVSREGLMANDTEHLDQPGTWIGY